MGILRDCSHTVHVQADEGPSEQDAQWAAENLNDSWHDLDGHPLIDDEDIAAESRYWQDEAHRYAADPTDADLDAMAEEAAWFASYEQGLKTF